MALTPLRNIGLLGLFILFLICTSSISRPFSQSVSTEDFHSLVPQVPKSFNNYFLNRAHNVPDSDYRVHDELKRQAGPVRDLPDSALIPKPPESLSDEELFERDRRKGCNFVRLMASDTAAATAALGRDSQSHWTYADLLNPANNWRKRDGQPPEKPADAVLNALGITWNDADMVPVRYRLGLAGTYDNVFGPRSHLIIARDNSSPSKDRTPLNQWSDVVFLEWVSQVSAAQGGLSVGSLKYVYRQTVVNTETRRVIDEALKRTGRRNRSDLRGGDIWAKRFEVTPDQDEFVALLGTPNIYGVCWFLINHKAQMGETRGISRIIVVAGGDQDVDIVVELT